MQAHPRATRRRSHRGTLALATCTLLCLVLAGTMRLMVDALPALTVELADGLAVVGASAAGAGVVLFGTTLVVAVLGTTGLRVPIVLAVAAGAVALAAVASAAAAASSHSAVTVAELGTLRTALAGLAATCLPAIALGAVRARAHRARVHPARVHPRRAEGTAG